MKRYFSILGGCFLLWIVVSACAPSLSKPANIQAVTAVPTLNMTSAMALCEAVNTYWNQDWATAIEALEGLLTLEKNCVDGVNIHSKLYTAYIAYGQNLERRGQINQAIDAYTTALSYQPNGQEATARLEALTRVTAPSPLERCEPSIIMETSANLKPYEATDGLFVQAVGDQLQIGSQPFHIVGVNYYPRDTPFQRFLVESRAEVISAEWDIILKAGFNTLRIFLRHDDLFICPGNGAVPVVERFTLLDQIIQMAARKGLRLIVVLNQDANIELYQNPRHVVEQNQFIVNRYREEPAILAWDIRDRGDQDYLEGKIPREVVLGWGVDISQLIRQQAPYQLITAGWWRDANVTAPFVDMVSFQHYGNFEDLRQTIAILKSETSKPILLSAIGYSTLNLDETAQRNLLFQGFDEARHNKLAGWLVYMAFDYPLSVTCLEPNCPSEATDMNYYGIWNTSYFPKLALDAVKTAIQNEYESNTSHP